MFHSMKRPISIRAISALLSIFVNVGISIVNAKEEKAATDPMTESLQRMAGKEFEAGFLQQMIQHHRGAVEMAKMVSSHTKRLELVDLATRIASTQGKEIVELTQWLKEWQGAVPEKVPNQIADKQMKGGMPMFEAARDSAFDKMFLEMMIEHHAGGVRMSRLVAEKSTRPELLKFAGKVIKDQTAEIRQMKDWKNLWFK